MINANTSVLYIQWLKLLCLKPNTPGHHDLNGILGLSEVAFAVNP